jgi:polysaccharide biosynthesis transport protein
MPTSIATHEAPGQATHSNVNAAEIFSAIFKHKWKIILFTLAGLIAAAVVYHYYPRLYQSQAKLLVRYVLDRSPVDPVDGEKGSSTSTGFGKTTENVINSELEILKSWDLAVQVAEAVGFKKLVPEMGDAANVNAAAYVVNSGLEVDARKGSDILFVSFTNRDPALTTVVLNELVNRYFVRHLEVHRSAAAFDFVSRQSDQVRARLNETDDALKALKAKAGMSSVADNTGTLSADIIKIEDQYLAAEAELAEQTARVKEIESSLGVSGSEGATASSKSSNAPPSPGSSPRSPVPADTVQQYQTLLKRLEQVRQSELELLSRYTPESDVVKLNRSELAKLENQKRELEKKFPDLTTQAASIGSSESGPIDIASEKTRLAGTKAKTETLKARLDERIRQLSEVGAQIADLERKKELEEANYKYFEGAVEKARVDEALDPSKMPNISAVQRPSPPMVVSGKRNKLVLALAGGGFALGVAFALLKELFLSQTLKRPLELEGHLRTPLLLTIPFIRGNGRLPLSARKMLQDAEEAGNGKRAKVAPWETNHFIRPYCEAIRDRLGLYFKLNGMTHKPKLVGVTGFSEHAGVSTLAAGLAAALSEMGDGKVLLVDVNLGSEDVHPFFKGKSAHLLTTALQPSASISSAADGLYLATVASPNETPMPLALKKFFDLMPNLKASDFDYIIFDMPALSQTSPTLGMAGFMDKTLVIVEAEKSNREFVRRGYAELIAARANVSVVLNKTQSYAPRWLAGES